MGTHPTCEPCCIVNDGNILPLRVLHHSLMLSPGDTFLAVEGLTLYGIESSSFKIDVDETMMIVHANNNDGDGVLLLTSKGIFVSLNSPSLIEHLFEKIS